MEKTHSQGISYFPIIQVYTPPLQTKSISDRRGQTNPEWKVLNICKKILSTSVPQTGLHSRMRLILLIDFHTLTLSCLKVYLKLCQNHDAQLRTCEKIDTENKRLILHFYRCHPKIHYDAAIIKKT